MTSLHTWACGAAFLAAALAASAAGAQRIPGSGNAQPTLVIGESLARACYERAVAGARSDDALVDCNRAIDGPLVGPDRPATFVNRAIVRQARGDLDGAIADITQAIGFDPKLAQAHVNLGGVYVALGRWREAAAELDQGIALAPDAYAEAHYLRGIAREELGDVRGAYDDYRKAVALAPDWEAPKTELQRFRVVTDGGAGGA